MEIAPILLIAFNRPENTQLVFNAICKAKPSKLYIFIDGPRDQQDELSVKKTKEIVKNITWKCAVKRMYPRKNLGCKSAVIKAINWLFANEIAGIILEDDCVPNQSFFRLTTTLLKKYRDDPGVSMISGTNYLSNHYSSSATYFFSKYYAIWGWATWRRAWERYDAFMSSWPKNKASGFVEQNYVEKHMQKYITRLFDLAYSGNINTWDIQWFYSCLLGKTLSIVPRCNLITNIGTVGTHVNGDFSNNNLIVKEINEKIVHPKITVQNKKYDSLLYDIILKPSLRKIMSSKLRFVSKSYLITRFMSVFLTLIHKIRLLLTGQILNNVHKTTHKKNCLIVYATLPFTNLIARAGYSHQNYWQLFQLSRVCADLGYNVDVVDYGNAKPRYTQKYDLVIDIHPKEIPLYANNITKQTIKVAYITGSSPSFSNKAEQMRIDDIYSKTKTRLKQRRRINDFYHPIQKYDAAIVMGNKAVLQTYKNYSLPKVYQISNTYQQIDVTLANKRSNNFLFLGGVGQVHKGLHLVLEAFDRMPNSNLYVCSPFKAEEDFTNLYHDLLFSRPNIIPIGHIDLQSSSFRSIAEKCGYCILPSCSEASAGSVVTCMSLGMIPIISSECGIDSKHAYNIKNVNIDKIFKTVTACQKVSKANFDKKIINTMIEAKIKYSQNVYINTIRKTLTDIVERKYND